MDDHSALAAAVRPPLWQTQLARAIRTPPELLAALDIDPALPALDFARLRDFPLRVPRSFVARMKRGDASDPLFLQVWPAVAEAQPVPGFGADAVGDLAKLKSGGVIHKYRGRALVVATGACAVHCRYCFRREFPYGEHLGARGHWRETLDTLRADSSISEVILSGGDPLALADDKLAELAAGLAGIPQLRRLRVHTRLPVVLPERVDAALLAWLSASPLQKVVVIHSNHAQELSDEVLEACSALRRSGATLLNQSVLLRGVNDSVEALTALSERLMVAGVLPYYLHVLDRVSGSAHFEVDENTARELMRALSTRLPGYLVPKLVREIAGEDAKTGLSW